MYKLLNRFIDWRKNIEKIDYYSLFGNFDITMRDFEDIKSDIYHKFDLLEKSSFKNKLLDKNIRYEKRGESEYYEAEIDFHMSATPKKRFFLSISKNIVPERKIYCSTLKLYSPQDEYEFSRNIAMIKGLSILILGNPEYQNWDNNHRPSSYRYRRGIRTYFDKDFHMTKVDISDRPGRISGLGNITWFGGHEYWFGSSFFKKVNKEKILSFKFADLIEELPNDIIHIKLMNMHEYWTDKGQHRLIELRKHLGIDHLNKEFEESFKQNNV